VKNIPLLVGTILGTLLLIVVIAFIFSSSSSESDNIQEMVDPLVVIGQARNVKIASTEAAIDDKNIVTIAEFSDFQCSACKTALLTVDQVMKTYPNQVRLIYRHFPLDSIHQNARSAAIAAEAVASIDKDKFWDMHDLLFVNQEKWGIIRDKEELNNLFATYAEKLDIDRTQFLERIENNSVIELVDKDFETAIQLGANATPTFYVNGIKTSAPQLLKTVESLTVSK